MILDKSAFDTGKFDVRIKGDIVLDINNSIREIQVINAQTGLIEDDKVFLNTADLVKLDIESAPDGLYILKLYKENGETEERSIIKQ